MAHHGLLPMFLTRRSVCLLACDASALGPRLDEPGDGDGDGKLHRDVAELEATGVFQWLRCLSLRAPGCDVILVATKCDLAPAGEVEGIADRLERACRWWLDRWADAGAAVNLEAGAALTSCVGPAAPCAGATGGVGGLLRRALGAAFSAGVSGARRRRGRRGWGCDWAGGGPARRSRPSLLRRITRSAETGGCRGGEVAVPRSWDVALRVLDELSAGRRV